jgi:hypothetical protein
MDQSTQIVKLHPDAKIISFEHKLFILNTFNKNIQGMLGIDYFSLMIVDSEKQVSFYSTCPALEFSLISDNLWELDGIFKAENHQDGAFFFWDELYPDTFKKTLIKEKETKFGFLSGFYVMKQLKDVFAIYSFATKSQKEKEMYRHSKDTLIKIGDCLYNELKSIHSQYVMGDKVKPSVSSASSYLKLIIDNSKCKKWLLRK